MGVLVWIGDALVVSVLSSPRNRRPGVNIIGLDVPVFNNLADELVDCCSTRATIHL